MKRLFLPRPALVLAVSCALTSPGLVLAQQTPIMVPAVDKETVPSPPRPRLQVTEGVPELIFPGFRPVQAQECPKRSWGVLFTVPKGKQLVIEHMSAEVWLQAASPDRADERVGVWVETRLSRVSVFHNLGFPPPVAARKRAGAGEWYLQMLSQPVRLYADAETEVAFGVYDDRWSDEDVICMAFSGYLMDTP